MAGIRLNTMTNASRKAIAFLRFIIVLFPFVIA